MRGMRRWRVDVSTRIKKDGCKRLMETEKLLATADTDFIQEIK